MPLAKKGKYGWGAFKDKPYRLGRVQQHVTAMRKWLQEQLKVFDVKVANPMHDGWIDSVMENVTRELGCGRVVENLPPKMTDERFEAVMRHADLDDEEEAQTVTKKTENTRQGQCRWRPPWAAPLRAR